MDLQNTGIFLAQLRKERGLTQEQLGAQLGVSNKTVSRWENGNYLPPVEVLQALSDLYGLSINELLCGQRLEEAQYREKAEDNILQVLAEQRFSFKQRVDACAQWLRGYWWSLLFFLLPTIFVFLQLPRAIDGEEKLFGMGIVLCLLGISVVGNHLIFYASGRAYETTQKREEFRAFRILRALWLVVLLVLAFVIYDLLMSLIFALTPAGSNDGYMIISRFYDILFEGTGDMVHNMWMALSKTLQLTLAVLLIQVDMTILWMKRG